MVWCRVQVGTYRSALASQRTPRSEWVAKLPPCACSADGSTFWMRDRPSLRVAVYVTKGFDAPDMRHSLKTDTPLDLAYKKRG